MLDSAIAKSLKDIVVMKKTLNVFRDKKEEHGLQFMDFTIPEEEWSKKIAELMEKILAESPSLAILADMQAEEAINKALLKSESDAKEFDVYLEIELSKDPEVSKKSVREQILNEAEQGSSEIDDRDLSDDEDIQAQHDLYFALKDKYSKESKKLFEELNTEVAKFTEIKKIMIRQQNDVTLTMSLSNGMIFEFLWDGFTFMIRQKEMNGETKLCQKADALRYSKILKIGEVIWKLERMLDKCRVLCEF
jgi:hypothetical protein